SLGDRSRTGQPGGAASSPELGRGRERRLASLVALPAVIVTAFLALQPGPALEGARAAAVLDPERPTLSVAPPAIVPAPALGPETATASLEVNALPP
ncbi:MAG TPA: hypothetical protein PK264_15020, partial [Hyphomicrobiaceae bacterium]|nr:hypothetical protein [Hyphomicrobiaceae bacterium]